MTESWNGVLAGEALKGLIALFGPVLALCGAIWLYFRKARDDRREAARQRRAHLYEEYISHISQVLYASRGLSLVDAGRQVALALSPVHNKISVVAPPFIVKKSAQYISSVMSIQGSSYRKPLKDITDEVELLAHLEISRKMSIWQQELLNAFRQDVYPDADPLPEEMQVRDRPEHSLLKQYADAMESATKRVQE